MNENIESREGRNRAQKSSGSFWSRRKWIIVICGAVGLIWGLVLLVTTQPAYRSTAALLVRYIIDSKQLETIDEDARIESPTSEVGYLLRNELEILSSFDLARDVAREVGFEKILGREKSTDGEGNGTDLSAAAMLISKNLTLEVPNASSVIRISFTHSDPEIAQKVLRALIDAYITKHIGIHRETGLHGDFLKRKRDLFKSEIATAESQIESLRQEAGIVFVSAALEEISDEAARIERDRLNAEVELALSLARLKTGRKDEQGKPNPASSEAADWLEEQRHSEDLQIQTNVLSQQLLRINAQATRLNDFALRIGEWQRKIQLAESNLVAYTARLESAELASTLGPGTISSISRIQYPTPPVRQPSRPIILILSVMVGGMLAGLAIAWGVEMVACRRQQPQSRRPAFPASRTRRPRHRRPLGGTKGTQPE